MDILQKTRNQAFIDYIPAELRENTEWRIIYYAFNPATDKLDIKRVRVPKMKSLTERRKVGKKMVLNINKRLEKNWNPFFDLKGSKQFVSFNKSISIYLKEINKEKLDGNLSKDTVRTYTSRIDNFKEYLNIIDESDIICYKIDVVFVDEFLSYLRYDKGVAARTRDNYLTALKTIFGWMKKKKYMIFNPCEEIKKIHKKKNDKFIIPVKAREIIFKYYEKNNPSFLVFCMCCYYCLVRRTELSKIKVSNVNLIKRTIYISSEDSKNNKSAHVTIPERLAILLANHLKLANNEDYLFSDDNYKPGRTRFKPNKATSNWKRMRLKTKIDLKIKWYYLKDTGIVDLIIAGVPLNSVRDQARHHSISQTNEYIPSNMKDADNYILNSGVNFNDYS
jgi:site-specific recombinase XerD